MYGVLLGPFSCSNCNTRKHGNPKVRKLKHENIRRKCENTKTKRRKHENSKIRWRKHESTMTEMQKHDDLQVDNYRVFFIVLSAFRHRIFVFSSFRGSVFLPFRHRTFVFSSFRSSCFCVFVFVLLCFRLPVDRKIWTRYLLKTTIFREALFKIRAFLYWNRIWVLQEDEWPKSHTCNAYFLSLYKIIITTYKIKWTFIDNIRWPLRVENAYFRFQQSMV